MKIGIYKPYKEVYFYDDINDLSAVSYEVVNVARIFAERNHTIHILSQNDLTTRSGFESSVKFYNIEDRSILFRDKKLNESYDRIILFSGKFSEDYFKEDIIKMLKSMTSRLDFLLTDLRLIPSSFELFNNIYTQATRSLNGIGGSYGGVAELICYKHQFESLENVTRNKNIDFYFGGTERGRLLDYIEYIWRPDCRLTGKSETLDFDTRVDRREYLSLLDRSKFSVVIADTHYNKNAFITPRYYENSIHDIINFVDYKYDPDGYFLRHDDWRRVRNYIELRTKINELKCNQEKFLKILNQQRQEIKREYIDGSYVYEKLGGENDTTKRVE